MDERSTLGMSSKELAQHWVIEALTCLEAGGSSTTLNQLKKLIYEDNHPLLASLKEKWPVVSSTGDHEQKALPIDLSEAGGFPETENLKLHGNLDDHAARNLTHQPKMDSNSPQDDMEMTDVAIKKAAFLRSRCMRDQDPVAAADSMGVNLCAKCSGGGELVVCSSEGCQVQVHRSCLVSTTTHDQIVSFCCPFCAYSRAVSQRREAERMTMLARNELMSFIGNDPTTELVEGPQQRLVEEAGEKVGQGCNSPTEEQFFNGVEGKEKSLVEGEAKPITSIDSTQIQKEENTNLAVLSGRRNKRRWTEMEANKLEEGVCKFWSGDGEIPWKQILEFGKDVFDGRTTVNLKDKWRNIQNKKAKIDGKRL